jgi:uncharacterized protein (DUF302 family)
VIVTKSASDFAQTTSSLAEEIERRGLKAFARIDHAGAAREAGLELDEEQVFLFGNPRAGTPLMRSDRRIGIELPLRILVWREGDQVLLAHEDPRELGLVYELAGLEPTLEQMASLLEQLVAQASIGRRGG